MITEGDFAAYKAKNLTSIKELLTSTSARPVLFLGAGITRRYLNAPSWMELLEEVASMAGLQTDEFNYICQKANNDPAQIGTLLIEIVHEWAWSKGKNKFPAHFFKAGMDRSIFLKHLVSEYLKTFSSKEIAKEFTDEVELIKKTMPHAIITTNFDTFIDRLFDDYELILGEKIIPLAATITGELFKIHGSISEPSTLVLTSDDYARFTKKRKYISSKMMTYFAEYPVIILGYGLGDTNVNALISDLGEAMREKGGLLDNVFYVEWVSDVFALTHLKEEHVVPCEPGIDPLRVRAIVTSDFGWILEGIADVASPVPVNLKLLRHLAARVVDLVRVDAPKHTVELDYKKIESLADDPSALGMLLGIGKASNPNMQYPYCLTQVAEKMGYSYWGRIQKYFTAANEKVGYDIKASDNDYHFAFKAGKKLMNHKYSQQFVDLLNEIKNEMTLSV
jgi:hypothetical protein